MGKLKRRRVAKRTNIIQYHLLKTGDVVNCGGKGLFAYVIRAFTAFKLRHKSKKASTHTAYIVEIHGQKLIAEMLSNGLNLNSLEEYNGKRKRFIIDICRPSDLTETGRRRIEEKTALDLRKGLEYDWKGDLAFVFKKIKDNPDKAFCSEYADHVLSEYGGVEITEADATISPVEFQYPSKIAPSLKPIAWRQICS